MAREFIMPGQIFTGTGALVDAADTLSRLGKRALIITDQAMLDLGNCNRLENILKGKHISYSIFSEITGEPTDIMVSKGLRQYRDTGADFLIALGGGSPIDAMKAIGCLVNSQAGISDYMGKIIDTEVPPMAAIPTTAGTGSEATQFTIITDTVNDIKMLLKGKVLMPSLAIIDPQFTMTVPPSITAATGLDALCHAVEAFTSRKAQTLSDTFAMSAVKRIFRYLPEAFHDGSNSEARMQMSVAALEAGIAFNNSSVTLIHGMSRPIGALFHIAHGLSNAMLIKPCLSFALSGACDRFAVLGKSIGAASDNDTDPTAAGKFLDAVIRLTNELKIPSLQEYGVNRSEFMKSIEKMSCDAMESGSPQNTRRGITKEDILQLYRSLWT